jgi:uncharacterized OB-fold protein
MTLFASADEPKAAFLRPLPDRDSEPFWNGLRDKQLLLPRCNNDGTYMFPSRTFCNRCLSFDVTWTELSGQGSVFSWIVTHHAPHKSLASTVPFTTVQVRVREQDDVLIPGTWVGGVGQAPEWGMPVAIEYLTVDDELTLIGWRAQKGGDPSSD